MRILMRIFFALVFVALFGGCDDGAPTFSDWGQDAQVVDARIPDSGNCRGEGEICQLPQFSGTSCEIGRISCNEGVPTCLSQRPPHEEVCGNQKDDDCDRQIDEGPEFSERFCNNIDDDCDGLTDENEHPDFPSFQWDDYPEELDSFGACLVDDALGICSEGRIECKDAAFVCVPINVMEEEPAFPSSTFREVCDGLDNDCDGLTDENGVQEDQGAELRCSIFAQQDICGEGIIAVCEGRNGPQCRPRRSPEEEVPDQIDNDCDGLVDEEEACDSLDNNGDGLSDNEVCDGVDNDCDDLVDEGLPQVGVECTVGACASITTCTAEGALACVCAR